MNPSTRVKDLTEPEVNAIRSQIAKFAVEGDLRREVSMNIKRLMDLGSLPRHPPPARTAGARPAHTYQRTYPQGSAQTGGEAERTSGQGIESRA